MKKWRIKDIEKSTKREVLFELITKDLRSFTKANAALVIKRPKSFLEFLNKSLDIRELGISEVNSLFFYVYYSSSLEKRDILMDYFDRINSYLGKSTNQFYVGPFLISEEESFYLKMAIKSLEFNTNLTKKELLQNFDAIVHIKKPKEQIDPFTGMPLEDKTSICHYTGSMFNSKDLVYVLDPSEFRELTLFKTSCNNFSIVKNCIDISKFKGIDNKEGKKIITTFDMLENPKHLKYSCQYHFNKGILSDITFIDGTNTKYCILIYLHNGSKKNIKLYNYRDIAESLYFTKSGEVYLKDNKPKYIKDEYVKFRTSPRIRPATDKEKLYYGENSLSYNITNHHYYTFGVEIETCDGTIPFWMLQNEFKTVSLTKDGSVYDDKGNKYGGAEYVTGPLKGDSGVIFLKRLLKSLLFYTKVNNTCGLHLHIGTVLVNKEFSLAMYKLALGLEKEIFSLMPPSRQKNEYCKKLPSFTKDFRAIESSTCLEEYKILIENSYINLFKAYSGGLVPNNALNKRYNHPRGRTSGYDKASLRYCWVNFLPLLFDSKGGQNYTVEFRIHYGTLNYTVIRNWLLICISMIHYAEKNYKEILLDKSFNITLKDVLAFEYSDKKLAYFIQYIEKVKEYFSNLENEKEIYSEDFNKNFLNESLNYTLFEELKTLK